MQPWGLFVLSSLTLSVRLIIVSAANVLAAAAAAALFYSCRSAAVVLLKEAFCKVRYTYLHMKV